MGIYGTNPFANPEAEDFASWTDEDWDRDAAAQPSWAGQPDFIDQADLARKAVKEGAA